MTEVFILKDRLNIDKCLMVYFGEGFKLLKTAKGAPYIQGSDKKISIAHKDKYVVIAISDKPVGVDIERVLEKASHNSIAKRYFAPIECGHIKREKDFFELWTRKEALGKLLGVGLNADILALNLINDNIVYGDKSYLLHSSFDLIDDYCITVAAEDNIPIFLYSY